MRIVLIIKPLIHASALQQLRAAVAELRADGHEVHAKMTFEKHDAMRFTRAALRRRPDRIIAAGGDGTVNEVVNGVVASDWKPRLAVVPLGTANDFARGLGIPGDIAEAMQIAMHGAEQCVDVARVNRRCFINVSTGGFGPEITKDASRRAKQLFGRIAYLFTALRKLTTIEPVHARFTNDAGEVYNGPFFFFAVGNARQTGGGTPVTPHADFHDARLDVAIVRGHSKRAFLTLLPALRAGKHVSDEEVLYIRTRELRVEPSEAIAVNADGEPVKGRVYNYSMCGVQLPFSVPN